MPRVSFITDSKKAGSLTISYLRFGPDPIRFPHLIDKANFVACHQCSFLDKYDMLSVAEKNSIFLLNSPYPKEDVWNQLSRNVQQEIIDKKIRFYTIDASMI